MHIYFPVSGRREGKGDSTEAEMAADAGELLVLRDPDDESEWQYLGNPEVAARTSLAEVVARFSEDCSGVDGAIEPDRVVAALRALRLAKSRDAVADRLDACERGTTGRERPRQQEDHGDPAEPALELRFGRDVELRAGDLREIARGKARVPPQDHQQNRDHEQVGRHGERLARLLGAAQVHRHQDQHQNQGGGDQLRRRRSAVQQRNDDPQQGNARESCLLYTSDAADDLLCVDLGGRRLITKKHAEAQ